MKPRVCSVFYTLFDVQSLVHEAPVLFHWIRVEYTRPENSSSSLGHDSDAEVGKVCAAALLNVTQIQEKGEDTGAALAVDLMRNEVVVSPAYGTYRARE